ncbi:MAG: 7,8-didemethyl-8-hydroxy-5-deazariboflavin synthase CofG [Terriglobales bacterium]
MAGLSTAALVGAAGALRDTAKGRVITYSRKVFIPLTHLCRDYCGYCTFRTDPVPGQVPYLEPDQVLDIAQAGRQAGCKEALFSLGDQPERRFPVAQEFLRRRGYATTLAYLAAMNRMVWERTGLMPHSNPGLMSPEDLRSLRQCNVSLGLMLENVSPRLLRGAHWRAPDKVPARRLRCLAVAGALGIPFTTGLLVGIGETEAERIESLLAIRELQERFGHIQEVIVQPFRAKPGTRMAASPEPSLPDLCRTLALARLILGGEMNIQSPPNLVPAAAYADLLAAGINDWGGISPVTRDWINPEAAWPEVARLAALCAGQGFTLRERLAIYPEFLSRPGGAPAAMLTSARRWQTALGPVTQGVVL